MTGHSDRLGIWLRDGIILLMVLVLHGSVFLMLGKARQIGVIEHEVASISMNLQVTPVAEEKIQGDVEGEPDPEQTMESSPLVKAKPEEELPQLQQEQDVEPKPNHQPKPQSAPEPKPEKHMQPHPAPKARPRPASSKQHPAGKKLRKTERKKAHGKRRKTNRKRPRHRQVGRSSARLAKVNAPGRLIRGSTKGFMRGPRQTSTGTRVSLQRVREYGSLVRARIARYQPRGASRKCRVIIAFSLSTSGSLRSARVARSCGAALDRAALRAVRRAAPFPRPPAGMAAAQLRFAIPFAFR